MNRLPLGLAVLLLLPLLSAPRPAAASEALRHEKYQLENGLTVILHVDHALPQVVVNTWYHVGTREEPKGRSGFAHMFEHLMFMGTTRVPDNQFDMIMETGGGANNASTWFDRTNYYDWAPSKMLPTLLWLEADRMEGLGIAMTQAKLDTQREVVRNERREGYDNAPYGPADYLYWQFMYPTDHPYHNNVIGSHEDLLAASVEDIVAFYDTYYVPNNATLVVAGAFEPQQVKPLIAGLFGSLPRGKEPPRRSAPPVGFDHEERVVLSDEVQFPRITLSWHSPAFYAPGDAEMDLLAFALTNGKSSRLQRRLVREEQLAVDVSAWQTSLRLGSVFRIDCHVKPDADLDRVEAIIDEELAKLLAEGPTQTELVRARAEYETSTLSELESLRERADRLNHYDAFLGTPDGLEQDLGRYRNATPASVAAWGRGFLATKNRLVLRVIPKGEPKGDLPSRETRPAPLEQKPFTPPLPEVFTLANGLRVWHFDRPGLPLVAARLLIPGGSSAVPREKAGVATLTADMLTEGAGDLDAEAFADALGLLGASLTVGAGRESTDVTLQVLQRNADAAFALLAKTLTAPRFGAKEFENRRALHVSGLQQLTEDAPGLARRVATEWFLGAGSEGAPVDGYPHTVEALTVADVRAYHERHFGPDGAILLLAGDLRTAEARALVERHLGSWKGSGIAAQGGLRPEGQTPLRVLLVDKPGAAQTAARFVFDGVSWKDDARMGLQVLNTLFGGSFTSRLNANLRETHAWTYGASSSFVSFEHDGLFVASANIQSDQTVPAIGEFLQEFARVRAGGVTAEEAVKARATVVADTVQGFESLAGILGSYDAYARYGQAPTVLAEDLRRVAASEPPALDMLAAGHLARPGGVLVLVGDAEQIKAQWAVLALPWGEGALPAPIVVSREDALEGRLAPR